MSTNVVKRKDYVHHPNPPWYREPDPDEEPFVSFTCPCGHAWHFTTALDAVLTLRGAFVACPSCDRKQRVSAGDVKALRRAARGA